MFKDQSLKSKLALFAGLIFCSNFFLSLPTRHAVYRSSDASRQLHILRHNRHPLRVNRAQITIFKQMH